MENFACQRERGGRGITWWERLSGLLARNRLNWSSLGTYHLKNYLPGCLYWLNMYVRCSCYSKDRHGGEEEGRLTDGALPLLFCLWLWPSLSLLHPYTSGLHLIRPHCFLPSGLDPRLSSILHLLSPIYLIQALCSLYCPTDSCSFTQQNLSGPSWP